MDADALFARAAESLRANRIAEARALFRQAADAGSRQAAIIHCNLVASREDWGRGLALLARLAASDARCRRQAELIRAMNLSATLAGEVVSVAPHLILFPALFTPDECRYLAE